jgi:SAM-dependent methyltransferase
MGHQKDSMTQETTLHVPLRFRRGGRRRNEEASIRTAVSSIEYMCEHLGLDDLGNTEMLDVGCGVKFTQAFINHGLEIQRYVGVDVFRPMIEFLSENVDDPRFEYHHINSHNPMYNPKGQPLSEATEFPLGSQKFDLICLFSVFTHLAPHDYVSMLRVVRKYVKPDGRLFYSLFIDELTENGHGLLSRRADELGVAEVGKIDTFRDLKPETPLRFAVYSRRYAHELIEGTGWTALSLSPPADHVQHHFVCAPS